MTTASAFWIDEYAAKAKDPSAFVQSGRSAMSSPIELLHTVRRMLQLLAVTTQHDVLDLGCGNGLLDIVLSGLCRRVTAVERVPELAERARENTAGCANVEVVAGDATELVEWDRRFDRILVWEALQLMAPADVRVLFQRMAGWLQPGGRIVLGCVPDARRREAFLDAYLDGVRQSPRLSPDEKAAIIARNERASWFDPAELVAWWREVGGEARAVELPQGREKSDHRLDWVLTREA